MDGLTRATTASRDRAQRTVLGVTAGAAVAALTVTGLLTVGLSEPTASAVTTSTTSDTTSDSSSDASASGASVGQGSSAPVASSGAS